MEQVIQVRDVVKTYPLSVGDFVAIDHLSLEIARGEFVAEEVPPQRNARRSTHSEGWSVHRSHLRFARRRTGYSTCLFRGQVEHACTLQCHPRQALPCVKSRTYD